MSMERLDIAFWAKSVSPSNDWRKWYGHDPARWDEFRVHYYSEMQGNPEGLRDPLPHLESDVVTFLYSSKEHQINNAVALRDYVLPVLPPKKRQVS